MARYFVEPCEVNDGEYVPAGERNDVWTIRQIHEDGRSIIVADCDEEHYAQAIVATLNSVGAEVADFAMDW